MWEFFSIIEEKNSTRIGMSERFSFFFRNSIEWMWQHKAKGMNTKLRLYSRIQAMYVDEGATNIEDFSLLFSFAHAFHFFSFISCMQKENTEKSSAKKNLNHLKHIVFLLQAKEILFLFHAIESSLFECFWVNKWHLSFFFTHLTQACEFTWVEGFSINLHVE